MACLYARLKIQLAANLCPLIGCSVALVVSYTPAAELLPNHEKRLALICDNGNRFERSSWGRPLFKCATTLWEISQGPSPIVHSLKMKLSGCSQILSLCAWPESSRDVWDSATSGFGRASSRRRSRVHRPRWMAYVSDAACIADPHCLLAKLCQENSKW
jgi:hypothetical protein